MNILITETQLKKLYILLENKNQKIIDKLIKIGLRKKTAIELASVAGKLSVFLAFKLLNAYDTALPNISTEEKFKQLEFFNAFQSSRNEIQSIVDWVRVELNGNIRPYEDLHFNELYSKSVEWHNSLNIGSDKINYVEENEVILDFRKNGIGFYWVDLATNRCSEEGERMGHCASSSGRLYSLREYKPLGAGKNTLNKSRLTMSLSKDGKILQLKGPKNSKPPRSLHEYILPLLYHRGENGHYLVNGFGFEYNSEHDFKLSDLDKSEIEKLYSLRPSLFENRAGKMVLISKGVIEKPENFNTFILSIEPHHIENYVDGSWTVVSKDRRGLRIDLFEAILSGDFHLIYDYNDYNWRAPLEYYTDRKNEKIIVDTLKKMCDKNNIEFDEDLSIENMIEEYDESDEIKDALSFSYNDAQNHDAYDHFYKTLYDCLDWYGEILNIDDTGVKIKIDLDKFNAEDYLNSEDLEENFEAMLNDYIIIKPKFYIDNRWEPNVSEEYFNELLLDRLGEI